MTTDGQGNWVATWYSYDTLGGTIGADRDTLVVRSTDAGANWSTPAPLNTNAGSDAGDDRLSARDQRRTGDLARGVWHSDDSLRGTIGRDDDILVAGSTDAGGQTGLAPTALNANAYARFGR